MTGRTARLLVLLTSAWVAVCPPAQAARRVPHFARGEVPLPREKPPVPAPERPDRSILRPIVGPSAREPADPETLARRWRALAEEQARRAARAEAMAARARRLGEELRAAQADRVALVARLREIEATVAARRQAIAGLEARIRDRQATLREGRRLHARALGALARLSRLPPGLALFAPDPPRLVLRRAAASRALADDLVRRAARVEKELAALDRDRRRYARELARLHRERDEQRRRRAALERAIARWRDERRKAERAIATERAALERLAREAADLRELIEALERRRADAMARHPPSTAPELPPHTPPFAQARGRLVPPAPGRTVRRFGARGAGGHERGTTLAVPAGAQVVAPWDGRVVFAAPFRSLGPLLIIAHGEGYHSLLAGLAEIYPAVGEWVLAGEPVGRMPVEGDGSPAGGDGRRTDRAAEAPLYFELRHDGRPVDPEPWLAGTADGPDRNRTEAAKIKDSDR